MNSPRMSVVPTVPNNAVAAATAPKMSARGLGFSYGGNEALRGINLDIAEGRVTALIGPSGCGK
jgi:phosphate transport system ATP-binding protein